MLPRPYFSRRVRSNSIGPLTTPSRRCRRPKRGAPGRRGRLTNGPPHTRGGACFTSPFLTALLPARGRAPRSARPACTTAGNAFGKARGNEIHEAHRPPLSYSRERLSISNPAQLATADPGSHRQSPLGGGGGFRPIAHFASRRHGRLRYDGRRGVVWWQRLRPRTIPLLKTSRTVPFKGPHVPPDDLYGPAQVRFWKLMNGPAVRRSRR